MQCKIVCYLSEIIQKTVKTILYHSILVLLLAENNTLTQVRLSLTLSMLNLKENKKFEP